MNNYNDATIIAELPLPTAQVEHPLISLVVPFYNEEETIEVFFATVIPALEAIPGTDFEIVCVDDGSRDATLEMLAAKALVDGRIVVVELTRNFGKEAALTAAIESARGDVVIPFDADLQDPPNVIPKLLEKWREGYEVVLARRVNRDSDTSLKKMTALWFYRAHNKIADIKIPENVGDFRLMSRSVVDALKSLPESRRFMKGLFAWVGFKTTTVDYVREQRVAGETKFSGWKLWNFALEGFTSFSTLPLRVWSYMGGLIAALAILRGIWLTVRTLIFGVDVPGYASLATAVLLLGGIQLIGIGVLGEYIGRIYFETKNRPVYLIRKKIQASRVKTVSQVVS
ncbi:glycosyltransferase family 2 protein [Herbaspirillum sp. alder98]|uniref:glycosyltransferase family 2 protein n=1 Tax=Herbaspirillum sp. alder98 TaxID=2913096 RepID=UPI001CD8DE8E|nr:glycosyltransferase family 2 protein [Herbaspirillum sp. alder98]MCA1322643.1 glycosyltransferase family 2 protein [Herbaspirillum sp. alder98]